MIQIDQNLGEPFVGSMELNSNVGSFDLNSLSLNMVVGSRVSTYSNNGPEYTTTYQVKVNEILENHIILSSIVLETNDPTRTDGSFVSKTIEDKIM
jgi:hypothetical protein